MVRMDSTRWPVGRMLLSALWTVVLALDAWALTVALRSVLSVQSCMPMDSASSWLGLKLAVIRTDVACPAGSYGAGQTQNQILSIVVLVALPAVLAQVGAGIAGVIAVCLLRRVAGLAHKIRLWLIPWLPETTISLPPTRRPQIGGARWSVPPQAWWAPISRRGPPVAC